MHRLPLLLILLILSTGCAPKNSASPTVVSIAAAPKARPVEEPAEQMRAATAEIGRSAAVIAQQTATISAANRRLQLDLGSAVKEADRMRKAAQLTQAEKDLLWENLTAIHLKHEDSTRMVETLQLEVQRIQGLQRTAEQRAASFERAAKDAQAEAAENARLLGLANAQTSLVEDKVKSLSEAHLKEKARADKMAGRLKIYDTVAIGIGLITAIYLLVRFVGPLVFPGWFAARSVTRFPG